MPSPFLFGYRRVFGSVRPSRCASGRFPLMEPCQSTQTSHTHTHADSVPSTGSIQPQAHAKRSSCRENSDAHPRLIYSRRIRLTAERLLTATHHHLWVARPLRQSLLFCFSRTLLATGTRAMPVHLQPTLSWQPRSSAGGGWGQGRAASVRLAGPHAQPARRQQRRRCRGGAQAKSPRGLFAPRRR